MIDTIVALATPPMMGALAIIRVSGGDAFRYVSNIFTKDLTKLVEKKIIYGNIKDGEELVDEVVVFCFCWSCFFYGRRYCRN